MKSTKPRLLIIGHARHGKDTVAEMIQDLMGLTFVSSSVYVGEKAVWPSWGKERYDSFEAMFEDRVNFRKTWGDLIEAYNTPDYARTARGIMSQCNMYVGIRRTIEFNAAMSEKMFDHVIWVDACGRLPKEPRDSNEMTADLADIHIDNNGPESSLKIAVTNLQTLLHNEGFDVGRRPTIAEYPVDSDDKKNMTQENHDHIVEERSWSDKPEHAVTVLDHGFFQVKEVMGSDESIAGSARMSYGRGTKKVNNDAGLINYLVKNHHTSPLEMGEIRFHMRLPIFVMRQLVRHRTANLNEYSGRYSQMVRLFYIPELKQICLQDKVNKQGSAEPMDEETALETQKMIFEASNFSFNHYELMLEEGVSRETARMVLPLNTYTEVVWKLDISNLIKFLYLRDDDHAQWEIREYAIKIAEAVEYYFPLVYAAYKQSRESVSLTQEMITALVTGENSDFQALSKSEQQVVYDLFGKNGQIQA